MKRPLLPLLLLGLVSLSDASPSFGYTYSDTRTLLTNDPNLYGDFPSAAWGGTLRTEAGDAPLYLNDVVTIDGAGWDANIASSFAIPPLDYLDTTGGFPIPGQYAFGTAIPDGVEWSFREIAAFDTSWNYGTPANGIYGFTVQLIGGDSPSATDVLASFDLKLEVVERLDVTASATATPIYGPQSTGFVNVAIHNAMGRDFVVTQPFIDYSSFDPSLDGSLVGGWDGLTIGAGQTTTQLHSEWRATTETLNGTYFGNLGVQGGLHYGDSYYLFASQQNGLVVQGVPEPTTMAALALGLGAFARRRRKG